MYRIVGKDGQQYGPVTAEQLRGWIAENRANAQTLVNRRRHRLDVQMLVGIQLQLIQILAGNCPGSQLFHLGFRRRFEASADVCGGSADNHAAAEPPRAPGLE